MEKLDGILRGEREERKRRKICTFERNVYNYCAIFREKGTRSNFNDDQILDSNGYVRVYYICSFRTSMNFFFDVQPSNDSARTRFFIRLSFKRGE